MGIIEFLACVGGRKPPSCKKYTKSGPPRPPGPKLTLAERHQIAGRIRFQIAAQRLSTAQVVKLARCDHPTLERALAGEKCLYSTLERFALALCPNNPRWIMEGNGDAASS